MIPRRLLRCSAITIVTWWALLVSSVLLLFGSVDARAQSPAKEAAATCPRSHLILDGPRIGFDYQDAALRQCPVDRPTPDGQPLRSAIDVVAQVTVSEVVENIAKPATSEPHGTQTHVELEEIPVPTATSKEATCITLLGPPLGTKSDTAKIGQLGPTHPAKQQASISADTEQKDKLRNKIKVGTTSNSNTPISSGTTVPAGEVTPPVVVKSLLPSPQSAKEPHEGILPETKSRSSLWITPTTIPPMISKQRFNYASFDCGALILSHNPGATSATSILHNNKDAYMLNKCSSKRFITVELCDDILVDTVMLANFEFFSSMFKDFEIAVSDRYPPKHDWTVLGRFRARNVRDFQYFKVDNPRIWARYLKVTFLSDYGHEYYCPLSNLRVYGTTMMEEMKAEEFKLANSNASATSDEDSKSGPIVDTRNVDADEYLRVQNTSATTSSAEIERETEAAGNVRESDTHTPLRPTVTPLPKSKPKHPREVLDVTPVSNAFVSDGITALTPRLQVMMPDEYYATASADDLQHTSNEYTYSADHTPGTQESIFKTIMKRLSTLERNATLTMGFLQEQSQSLNAMFDDLERNEDAKVRMLIGFVNRTLGRIYSDLVGSEHMDYTRNWAVLRADIEMHTRFAQVKIDEVTNLTSELKSQMSRQFVVQSLMTLLAVLAGAAISKLAAVFAKGRSSVFNSTQSQARLTVAPAVNTPSNSSPTPHDNFATGEAPSILVSVTSAPPLPHRTRDAVLNESTGVTTGTSASVAVTPSRASVGKKKRKRRKSTAASTLNARLMRMMPSKSENDVHALSKSERRGSAPPEVLQKSANSINAANQR
ncbi:UNC-like C-terminal-domain-containing protein [Gaertneriomyces semiglobifer]|nr:UNC-like C-terminal-domain-containing protein [Gaertneriomyces semiglobifer]